MGRKVGTPDIIPLERGKIPPQAVDLEEVVLGAMMIDKKGVDEVIDILHPDVFYKDAHLDRLLASAAEVSIRITTARA